MTPRERAEELLEDLQYLENDKSACQALIEQSIDAAVKEAIAVTDIHAPSGLASKRASEMTTHDVRVLQGQLARTEEMAQRQREINAAATQRVYGVIRDMLGIPPGEALLNGVERVAANLVELEAALRTLDNRLMLLRQDAKGDCDDIEGAVRYECTGMRELIAAALSPTPAQPATATKSSLLDEEGQRVVAGLEKRWKEFKAARKTAQDDRTIFCCKTCDRSTWGWTDGRFENAGWGRIDNIDGPNAICPRCQQDSAALDGLREDYPDAALSPAPAQPATPVVHGVCKHGRTDDECCPGCVKDPKTAQPATATKPLIVGREVISEPGASVRIERLELSKEAQRGLSVGKVAAENFQRAHAVPPSPAATKVLPVNNAKLTPAQEANGKRDVAFEDAAEREGVNSSTRDPKEKP